jgi:CDGSH-type Zn-finger protein
LLSRKTAFSHFIYIKEKAESVFVRLRAQIIYEQAIEMAKTKITVNNNGSLRIEGEFEIVDKEGNVYGLGGRELVSICRCGRSQNKPFCDGSHKGHFEHEAIAFDLPPKKQ